MVNFISTVYNGLLAGIKYLLVFLTTILIIVVFGNVVSRYFLNFALAWSEETARFLFIWVTFLGAILANANNEHMRLDVLINWMPKKVGQAFSIVANIVIIVILVLVIKGGITIAIENYNWMTPALEISYGLVYSIVPLCCVILLLQTVARVIRIFMPLFGFSKDQPVIKEGL